MHIAEHVRLMRHEDGAFVMNIKSDRCFGVNLTGAAILSALGDGLTSPDDIARHLIDVAAYSGCSADEFDMDAVREDVADFVRRLTAAGIIE